MIKRIVYNFVTIILLIFTLLMFLGVLYFTFSNIYYKTKNWNHLEKGLIKKIEFTGGGSEGGDGSKIYYIKIDKLTYLGYTRIDTDYNIGDKVLVQYKGNNNATILYVNGVKVDNKINFFDFISLFMSLLIIFMIWKIIKKKKK